MKNQICVGITPDATGAVLDLYNEEQSLGHAVLSADELSTLISVLGQARQDLGEPIPGTLDPNPRLPLIDIPAIQLRRHPGGKGMILLIRHPGFGWQAFTISPEECKHLARAFQR